MCGWDLFLNKLRKIIVFFKNPATCVHGLSVIFHLIFCLLFMELSNLTRLEGYLIILQPFELN